MNMFKNLAEDFWKKQVQLKKKLKTIRNKRLVNKAYCFAVTLKRHKMLCKAGFLYRKHVGRIKPRVVLLDAMEIIR